MNGNISNREVIVLKTTFLVGAADGLIAIEWFLYAKII